MFIQVKNVASLFKILQVFEYFLAILETSLFAATCKNSLSAKCISAAHYMCKDADIFRETITSSKQILH